MRKWLSTLKEQQGAAQLGGLMLMGIAMIFVAVGFIIYPTIMTGTDNVLAYEYTSNTSITDSTFTGLTAVTGVTPLICLLGFVSAAVLSGVAGFRAMRGMSSGKGPGSVMLIGIGQIFIAVMIIIFPVVLDGLASILHGGGDGISSSYTGLSAVVQVTPLIVLTGGIIMTVVSQYFGGRKLLS